MRDDSLGCVHERIRNEKNRLDYQLIIEFLVKLWTFEMKIFKYNAVLLID